MADISPSDAPRLQRGVTSIRARFQRSVVGAVSLIVTVVPEYGVRRERRLSQKVEAVGLRNSVTLVGPAPTVQTRERSQSVPVAQTHALSRVVIRVAEGAPEGPLAPAVAPTAAFLKATTVSMPPYEPVVRVAVTTTLVSLAAAGAVQISAVPYCALTRRASDQVRPPPVTPAIDCVPAGPSEPTKAASSSFGPAVVFRGR